MSETGIRRDPFVTPFVERQLSLSGTKAPEGRFPAYMKVDFKENNGNKITLHFGSGIYGEDQRQKSINLDIGAYTFSVLAQQAKTIGQQQPGFEYRGHKINGLRQKRPGDQTKGAATGWDGTVFIGKDSQGVCYICAMSKNVQKIKIPFAPDPQFVTMVDVRTNEPASMDVVSCDYAEAWGNTLLPIVGHLLVLHPYDFKSDPKYVAKNGNAGWKDRPAGGGGGGNGGYPQRQGGGGYQQQPQRQQPAGDDMSFLDLGSSAGSQGFDDDIPV